MAENDTKRILVVDDEDNIRELLVEVLEIEGYEPETARDGVEAISILEKQEFDLIITDLMMPNVDGLGVLSKAKEFYTDIVVLMMTGKATVESAIRSLQLGANDYITKPFEIQDLLYTVRKNLKTQDILRENIRLHRQTERDREELKKLVAELTVLQNLSINFSYTFSFPELTQMILDAVYKVISYSFAATVNVINNNISIKTDQRLSEDNEEWLKKTLFGLLEDEGYHVADPGKFSVKYLSEVKPDKISATIESIYPLSFKYEDNLFGIMLVCHLDQNAFNENDIGFLNKLAGQASETLNRLKKILEQQRQKYQIMIDGIPDGVIIYDSITDAVIVNPSAKQMLKPGEPLEKNDIEELFGSTFAELEEKLQQNQSIKQELFLTKKEDSVLVISANIANLSSGNDLIQGVIMALRDVTREHEIDQLKKEFISNVSHELRTPAAVVKEFISILNDEVSGPVNSEQRDYLSIMQQNIERLLRLIENLLNMSRVESGRIKLRKNDFELKKLLKIIIPSLEVRLRKKNIDFRTEFRGELDTIHADSDALTQVITNLVDNARKFSPEGSEVVLGAKKDRECYTLWVKDQGRGIPQEHLHKIFDRFHRIEPENVAREEGAGLGLPIVKEIVKLHNGKIWVESQEKKGSTFFFTICRKK